ncbi:MAG: excalibur calcium-binding domain-containing protein [Nitratireductor sp.]
MDRKFSWIAVLAGLAMLELFGGWAMAQQYDCRAKYCSQMGDCGEAWYHLKVCGDTGRDADGDGIPCENVCGKSLEILRKRLQASDVDPDAAGGAVQFVPPPRSSSQQFDCSVRKSCKQMVICEEATFHLRTCGNRKLDGNHDGIACNSICRNR